MTDRMPIDAVEGDNHVSTTPLGRRLRHLRVSNYTPMHATTLTNKVEAKLYKNYKEKEAGEKENNCSPVRSCLKAGKTHLCFS
ncbi:hypothetical protein RRG08_013157 [Elysia crispata]|uniref:Uncharacterized protein n=1 Tax=Elysia crispata TaxID=231223 RepID=A0AAE1A0A4_9GAST|nr:hypothetical protein RRG08_013157 [Elysia crispata]